jgi:hypothetical protein
MENQNHSQNDVLPLVTLATIYVYFITNGLLDSEGTLLWKIGITNNIPRRMNDLFTTGVPARFQVRYAFSFCEDVTRSVEKFLHGTLLAYRPNNNREFFALPDSVIQSIIGLLRSLGCQEVDIASIPDIQTQRRVNIHEIEDSVESSDIIWLKNVILNCLRIDGTRAASSTQRNSYVSKSSIKKQIQGIGENFCEFKEILSGDISELSDRQKTRIVFICDRAIETVKQMKNPSYSLASLRTIKGVCS